MMSREASVASTGTDQASEGFVLVCSCINPQPKAVTPPSGFDHGGSHPSRSRDARRGSLVGRGSGRESGSGSGSGSGDGSRPRKISVLCLSCGREVRKPKSTRRRPQAAAFPRNYSGSGYRHPGTPETAMDKFDSSHSSARHERRKCSGKDGQRMSRSTSKNIHDAIISAEHRVRFDEQVTHVVPDDCGQQTRSPLKYTSSLEDVREQNPSRKDHQPRKKSPPKKKLFVRRRNKSRSPKPRITTTHIPKLGVSVHKMAYDLALKDTRLSKASEKRVVRHQSLQPAGQFGNGTVFSYFPLLKRPLSESDKFDLGLRAMEVDKVKSTDYMKHIFGKIKLADYYPGGKKWRKPEPKDRFQF